MSTKTAVEITEVGVCGTPHGAAKVIEISAPVDRSSLKTAINELSEDGQYGILIYGEVNTEYSVSSKASFIGFCSKDGWELIRSRHDDLFMKGSWVPECIKKHSVIDTATRTGKKVWSGASGLFKRGSRVVSGAYQGAKTAVYAHPDEDTAVSQ